MKTKNTYKYPIDKKNIKKIIKEGSPAHKIYRYKKNEWDLTKAVDFICDEKTPVKASRKGRVYSIKDDVTENYKGFDEPDEDLLPKEKQDGNYVVIEHENDEFSFYGHLEYKQVKVKKGEELDEGQIIGYSGDTGWSIKPHLHFMVFNFKDKEIGVSEGLESLEINWDL